MEELYRAYREVIAVGIRVLRPHTEVTSVRLEELEEAVARFDPDVVISSIAPTADCGDRLAWVKLSVDPAEPTISCVGGHYSERPNPGLDVLLEIVDDAEQFLEREDAQDASGARNQHQSEKESQPTRKLSPNEEDERLNCD